MKIHKQIKKVRRNPVLFQKGYLKILTSLYRKTGKEFTFHLKTKNA